MRKKYLGDSYDIVKQSLLRWLGTFGEWSVHPMFTEDFEESKVAAFEKLLGVNVVSREILTVDSDRTTYLQPAFLCGNLFLDPDTGLRMRSTRGVRAPEYIFADELVQLVSERPTSLTVVFDQSVGRGAEELHLDGKLRELRRRDVHGFAYISHACFLVTANTRQLAEEARTKLIVESRLPPERLLILPEIE